MTNFKTLISNRRSTRKFTSQTISPEDVTTLLEAALKSPTGKNSKCWQFVVVENKDMLAKLAECKAHGGGFIANSSLAIVVTGDCTTSETWIEDASIAATLMQLQAEDLGLGSCWCQVRGRETAQETPSADYVMQLLDIPYQMEVLCIIAFGHKDEKKSPQKDEDLPWEKVHLGKFSL